MKWGSGGESRHRMVDKKRPREINTNARGRKRIQKKMRIRQSKYVQNCFSRMFIDDYCDYDTINFVCGYIDETSAVNVADTVIAAGCQVIIGKLLLNGYVVCSISGRQLNRILEK